MVRPLSARQAAQSATRAALVVVLLAGVLLPDPSRAVADPPAPPREALDAISRRYQIAVEPIGAEFTVETRHGPITGRPASEKELAAYVPLFFDEFSIYPAEFVRRSRLERIVLCVGLAFDGQRRSAIPDYEHDTLYLDATRERRDPRYLRKVIHHECFHVVDYRDDGEVYRDDGWLALHPKGFQYGTGGRNAQGQAGTSLLTDKYPGFLNHYSTTGVEEDKAELFANLIVEPAHVAARMKADPVIAAKVERMKTLLAEFCPELDEAFWERIDSVKRLQE